MAIGTQAINAGDVQRAFTTDLSGLQNTIAQYAQNLQRGRLVAENQKQERDAQSARLLGGYLKDLRTPTGTPYDSYAEEQIPKILNSYKEYVAKNPNASYLDQVRFMEQQAGALAAQKDKASLLQKQAEEMAKIYARSNPEISPEKLSTAISKYLWYSPEGNVRLPESSSIGEFFSGLTDDNFYKTLVDEENLNKSFVDYLDKNFAEQGRVIPIPNSVAHWEAGLRPYEDLDVSTGERRLRTEPMQVGDSEVSLLDPSVYQALSMDRRFRIANELTKERLSTLYPFFAELTPEQQNRAAASVLLENTTGSRTSRVPPKMGISEVVKFERDLRRDEENRAYRNQRLKQIQERIDQGKKENKNKKGTYSTFDYLIDEIDSDDTDLPLETIDIPRFVSVGGVPIIKSDKIEAAELSALTPSGMFKATDGSGNRLKVYKDLESGNLIVEVFEQENKDGLTTYKKTRTEEIRKENAKNYLKKFKGQLSRKVSERENLKTDGLGELQTDELNEFGFEDVLPPPIIDFSKMPE